MQAKFYNLPTDEPEPVNRRVYAAAKLPFHYLWIFLTTIISPWLYAFPFAMAAATLVCLFGSGLSAGWMPFVIAVGQVGVVYTVFLGAFFALIAVFS